MGEQRRSGALVQTPWVGRAAELLHLGSSIGPGVYTFIGPPGSGKTRLAIEVCLRAKKGDWLWVDLTGVRQPNEVASAVASAAGMGQSSEGDLEEHAGTIGAGIAARGYRRVVLDNYEAAVAEANWWPDAMATSTLSVLVTSREALGTPSETRVPVAPLEVEDACALFVDRAARLGLVSLDAALVRRLVESVDRLPLAIELAAGRLPVLGMNQLITRAIDGTLRRAGCAPGRHTALEDAIGVSWETLEMQHRVALRSLTCFDGPFGLSAAEAVLGDDFVEQLSVLHNRSLLCINHDDDEPRYHLLLSIASYARRQPLDPDPLPDATNHHLTYFVGLAKQIHEGIRGTGYAAAVSLADQEQRHLRSALHFAKSLDAGHLAFALDGLYEFRASWRRRVQLLSSLLERTDLPNSVRVEALDRRAFVYSRSDRNSDCKEDLAAAEALASSPAEHRMVLHMRAETARRVVSVDDFAPLLEALESEADDLSLAHASSLRSVFTSTHSSPTDSLEHIERARELFRESGTHLPMMLLGINAAFASAFADQLERARVFATEALRACRSVGHGRGESVALMALAFVELNEQNLVPAQDHFKTAERLHRESGDPRTASSSAYYAGLACLCSGLAREAEEWLSISRRPYFVAAPMCAIGAARVLGNDHEGASQAYAEADAELEQPENARLNPQWRAVYDSLLVGRTMLKAIQALEAGDKSAAVSAFRNIHETRSEPPVVRGYVDQIKTKAFFLAAEHGITFGEQVGFTVGPAAVWIRLPDGEVLDFRKRATLRRLMDALLIAGEPLSVDELHRAGWPGEPATRKAATNRTRVALTELRKRGLRPYLQRHEGGYRLDPALPIRRA